MSRPWAALPAPASRLLEAARRRAAAEGGVPRPGRLRVLASNRDGEADPAPLEGAGPGERVLVLGWIGTHRDAKPPALRGLWLLEEAARATGASVLVLRLAPLIGPEAPLVAQLARRPRLDGHLERALVQPVLESDVVVSLASALQGRSPSSGWFEVCGSEALSVGEWRDRIAGAPGLAGSVPPAWEPSEAILRAQGLAESQPWARAFGISPGSVTAWLAGRLVA